MRYVLRCWLSNINGKLLTSGSACGELRMIRFVFVTMHFGEKKRALLCRRCFHVGAWFAILTSSMVVVMEYRTDLHLSTKVTLQSLLNRPTVPAIAETAAPLSVDMPKNAETFSRLLDKHRQNQNAVLSGRIPLTRAIIARCGMRDECAGLGDRLFGIALLYLGAVLTDRAFFIDYVKPKAMENYLVPNKFEWRIGAIKDTALRGKVKGCSNLQRNFDSCQFLNLLMPGRQCGDVMSAVFSAKNVLVMNSDHRTECVQKMLVKQGVVPPKWQNGSASSLEHMRQWAANVSHIMLRTLFRPNEAIAAAIVKALTPTGFTAPVLPHCLVCVHVRSGSGVGEDGRHTNWKDFASCGMTAHDALLKSHTCKREAPWLIVGDSSDAPAEIEKEVGAERNISMLTTTGLGPPVHIDRNNEASSDMVQHVFTDWFLLTRCRYFVASLSTFAATASLYGGPSVRRWDMEVGGHSGGCNEHRISDWQRDANAPG